MSSSRFAPVQQIAWTLPRRIISASDMPSSAVLIAPASVTSILPPLVEVPDVAVGRVDERGGVEVPVVVPDEVGDRAHRLSTSGVYAPVKAWKIRKSRRAPQYRAAHRDAPRTGPRAPAE